MSEKRKCEACHEPIIWNEEIVKTDDGEVYHEECCKVFPIMYGVMIGDSYMGNSYDGVQEACMALDYGDYIGVEEEE